MIVIIRADATEEQVRAIVARAVALGMGYHLSRGAERAVLVLDGVHTPEREQAFAALDGVDQVLPLTRPFRLSAREVHPQDTVVQVEGLLIGRGAPCIVAGSALPAADPNVVELAVALREAGAQVVRTGVYRPASELFGTPQLDPDALARLDGVRRESGLPVAVEVLAAEDIPAVARHADVLIVGAAQMRARPLLQACGWCNRPVILQRSESAELQEWLQAADHLLACGNRQVLLCEQGIRTYEPATRRTLDLSAVPLIRRVSHLPVLVDPCQPSGHRYLVEPLALAAVAAGTHGLLLEVRRPDSPAGAEGDAAIGLDELRQLTAKVRTLTAEVAPARPPDPR